MLETAHHLINYCGNIFRYAIATGRADRDVSVDLSGALPPSTPAHHASITEPQCVAVLLRRIDGYRGSNVTRYAPQLALLVFVPLSTQAVAVLRALQPLTRKGRYVFPGARSRERPMSENTVNGGLRRLGWSGSSRIRSGAG